LREDKLATAVFFDKKMRAEKGTGRRHQHRGPVHISEKSGDGGKKKKDACFKLAGRHKKQRHQISSKQKKGKVGKGSRCRAHKKEPETAELGATLTVTNEKQKITGPAV